MTFRPRLDNRAAKWALGGVLLLALAFRMGWAVHQSRGASGIDALPDQREYLEIGQNLLGGRGMQFNDPRFHTQVWAYRTPGYPLFIAACGGKPAVIRAAQAALDTLSVLAVYLLARWWLPPGASVIAAFIVAFNPFLIYFSGLILSETLFTALLIWGLVLIVHSGGPWPRGAGPTFAWLAGGLLLALAALVRPSALLLPVAAGFAGAFVNRTLIPNRDQTPAYRWHLPVSATFLILTLLVFLPWAARNEIRLHQWIWTSTNDGITRYDGFNPDATGASDQTFVKNMPELAQMNEIARSRYLGRLADAYIAEHPSQAAKLTLAKIGRTWSPMPLSAEYGSRAIYRVVALCYSVPLFLLTVFGLALRGLPRAAKALLLMPAVYFTIVHAASIGSLRYRIPVEAPMAVIAAGFASRWGAGARLSSRRGEA